MNRGGMMDLLLRARWLWCLGVILWAVVLWTLSANSSPPMGPSFPMKDKLLHCLYFAGGAFCFLLSMPVAADAWRRSFGRDALIALLFTGVIGALDEYHQTFTPGRSGNDPWDWLADVSGGLLGAWLVGRLLVRLRPAAE